MAEKFSLSMLRKFTPKYEFNPFTRYDVDEINNLMTYASGLIIKDQLTADELETDKSLKMSDRYIRAIDGNLKKAKKFEINAIIKNYVEINPYYKALQDEYNIDPYTSRKAKDMTIIASMESSSLSVNDQSLFNKCFYETIEYFKNVTMTDAFSNQDYNTEFFNWYLSFSTILKFLNYKMEYYFDVDSYDKNKLKNGFISWGMDYFDEFPLVYQRRIYKAINDLVRSKGTNEVFIKIKEIFSFAGIDINKYYIAKSKDKSDLNFFRTPIDKDIDYRSSEMISYEEITEDDPYWRVEKEDLLENDFSPLATKYISIDAKIDMIKNSRRLSYFYTFLNIVDRFNKDKIEAEMIKNSGLSYEEASKKYGILSEDFSFRNSLISKSKINIYNAIIALTILVFKRMNWSDEIHRKLEIGEVYQYNSKENLTEKINEVRKNLYWNKKKYTESKWNELMDLMNEFKVKDFENFSDIDLKEVVDKFKSSSVYSRQALFVSDYAKDDVIPSKLEDERYYDVMEYITNSVLNNKTEIKLKSLYKYTYLQDVLTDFTQYSINAGYFDKNKIYNCLINNEDLLNDVKELVSYSSSGILKKALSNFENNKTVSNSERLFIILEEFLESAISNDQYKGKLQVELYTSLNPFMNIFISNIRDKKDKIFSIRDFVETFYYNEDLRERIQNAINETPDPDICNTLIDLWNSSYTSMFDMKNFKGYKTFSEYLLNVDPELYYYIQNEKQEDYNFNPDYSKIYRDKIIELSESISSYLDLKEDLFIENNFIGISSYIKEYMYILATIFKSYTLETVKTKQNLVIDDKFENGIRINDSFALGGTNLFFKDTIILSEAFNMKVNEKLNEESIKLTDSIKFTVNEN